MRYAHGFPDTPSKQWASKSIGLNRKKKKLLREKKKRNSLLCLLKNATWSGREFLWFLSSSVAASRQGPTRQRAARRVRSFFPFSYECVCCLCCVSYRTAHTTWLLGKMYSPHPHFPSFKNTTHTRTRTHITLPRFTVGGSVVCFVVM